jgi:hypothetical protein
MEKQQTYPSVNSADRFIIPAASRSVIVAWMIIFASGCSSTVTLTDRQAEQLWSLDSLPDGDVKVELQSGTMMFDLEGIRVVRGSDEVSLRGLPKSRAPGVEDSVVIPLLAVRRIWFDRDIEVLFADSTEESLEAGEWCMEFEDAQALRLIRRASEVVYMFGKKQILETAYPKETIVRFSVSHTDINVGAVMVIGAIPMGFLVKALSVGINPSSGEEKGLIFPTSSAGSTGGAVMIFMLIIGTLVWILS